MHDEGETQKDGRMKKFKRRRNMGIALLIVGVLCVLLSFVPSSSTSYSYYPNGQGGIIPYPTSSTSHPFLFMIVPGIVFMVAGVAVVLSSRRRLKKDGKAETVETATPIKVTVANEETLAIIVPSQMIDERSKEKFCRFCGTRLETSDKFCSDCGKKPFDNSNEHGNANS